MPPVTLSIAGRLYDIACDESQIDHMRQMAALVDERAQTLTNAVGLQPEARLLLMVAMMLADELAEEKAARDHAQSGLSSMAGDEVRIVEVLSELTGRIEGIARRLERS